MPFYKFAGNKILTWCQNRLLGTEFSEFHSGYRVYSVAALKRLPFDRNTNDFHFDTEIIIQLVKTLVRVAFATGVRRVFRAGKYFRFHVVVNRNSDLTCII